MSLFDCLNKIKLDKKVVNELTKEVKALTKKGMSQSEAEQSALASLIEKTREEVETVRDAIGGDLAPVELKVDEAKTFYQFAGRKANNAPIDRLQEAEKLGSEGVLMEKIRKKTGWFKGQDNRWRFEISDEKATLKNKDITRGKSYKLSEIIDHEDLFIAYPELKDLNVVFKKHRGSTSGVFSPKTNTLEIMLEEFIYYKDKKAQKIQDKLIEVNSKENAKQYREAIFKNKRTQTDKDIIESYPKTEDFKKASDLSKDLLKYEYEIKMPSNAQEAKGSLGTILHEIQHSVQRIEGFSRGTNSQAAGGNKNYLNTHGEIEARDVESRMKLSKKERANLTPAISNAYNPIIHWNGVERELPIDLKGEDPFSEINKDKKKGEQLALFQSKVDSINIPDEYFENPVGSKELPSVDPLILKELGLPNKPLILKENIAIKNKKGHPELKSKENLEILKKAIYSPDEIIQVKKTDKPNYFSFISRDSSNNISVIELSQDKENFEIVNWYKVNDERLKDYEEKAKREGGEILITNKGAAHLSALPPGSKIIPDSNGSYNQGADTKRGSIEFKGEQKIIRLFKEADKSTFVHEMGHLFLQDFYEHVLSGDASEREIKDWMKLSSWLEYNPAQKELTTEQHEKWARGFEAYLMEGKAPTKALQKAFGQFRRWLTKIYKTVQGLDVELNDDVRGVMDRMLATDQEIAIARKQIGLDNDIDLADVPDKVKAKLEDIRLMAEEKAFATLFKDQMKEMSQEHKDFIAAKTKEVTAQVKAEIEASPEGQEIIDTKDALKTKDIWKRAGQFLNGLMTEEQGLQFEMIGEEFGYTSGDHFAQAIKAMVPIKDQIKAEVENRMREFTSATDKEVVRANAMREIHNSKSVELLGLEKEIFRQKLLEETESENQKIMAAMEKADAVTLNKWLDAKEKHLVKKAFNEGLQKGNEKLEKELSRLAEREKERRAREDQKRLVKEFLAAKDEHERKKKLAEFRDSVNSLNRIIAGYTRSEADIVKVRAKEILAKKPIKETVKFTQYFTAEKNAAIRVVKAVSRNDWSAAIVAKQEQMLNHALARESIRIKKEIERHTKYLNEQRTASAESFKNEDHLFQVSKILDRFGFGRKDFDPSMQGETLAQWVDKYDAMTGIVAIEDWLHDERINIKTGEMNIDQLRDIRNAVQNIKQVANYENEISKLNGKQTIAEIAGDLIQESQTNFNPKERFKNKFEDTKVDKLKGWARLYMFSLKKIETIVGPLGGWRDNSLWNKYFNSSVYEAANAESVMIQEATKAMEKNWSIYTNQERKDIYNKKIFVQEFGISLTKDRLLAMAHNLGNDGNRERLFVTRPIGLDQSVPWGEGMVMAILQRELTEKDWKFVQSNWDHLESYWSKIASLHKRLTGFTPGKVEHRKFSVVSNGQKIDLNGGYYPLKADPRNSFKDEVRDSADSPLYTEQNIAWKAATKKGHTKERVKAQYPVSLDLGIINRHLQDVIHDLAFRETVMELNKLVGREDMQAEMKATLTPEGYKAVKEYIASVAGGQGGDPVSAIDKVMKLLRQNTTRAALFYKVSVITQNFANAAIFPNAVDGFGYADAFKSYFKYGIGDYALKIFSSEGKEIREMVYSKSAFMKDRADSPDYSIEEIHSKFSKHEVSEMSKMAGGMMAWTDEFTNIPMWIGAYNKSISEGKSEQDAVKYADTLIMRVAGSSRKYDVASITRGTETQKIFAMFFSWLNTEHNRWMREVGIFKRDKDVSRALGFLAGRMVFQAIGAALMFRLPDWEDEEEVKKFMASISIGLPVSFFPGLREVVSVASEKAMGVKSFGYNPSPAFASIDYGLKGFGAMVDVAEGKISKQDATERVAKAASYSFGYPDQFNQWFFNMYDYTDGMEPKLHDIYRRRPKKERNK